MTYTLHRDFLRHECLFNRSFSSTLFITNMNSLWKKDDVNESKKLSLLAHFIFTLSWAISRQRHMFFKLDRYRETCQVLLFGTICGKQRIQEKQIIFFNVFNNKKKKIENYRWKMLQKLLQVFKRSTRGIFWRDRKNSPSFCLQCGGWFTITCFLTSKEKFGFFCSKLQLK